MAVRGDNVTLTCQALFRRPVTESILFTIYDEDDDVVCSHFSRSGVLQCSLTQVELDDKESYVCFVTFEGEVVASNRVDLRVIGVFARASCKKSSQH